MFAKLSRTNQANIICQKHLYLEKFWCSQDPMSLSASILKIYKYFVTSRGLLQLYHNCQTFIIFFHLVWQVKNVELTVGVFAHFDPLLSSSQGFPGFWFIVSSQVMTQRAIWTNLFKSTKSTVHLIFEFLDSNQKIRHHRTRDFQKRSKRDGILASSS